MPDAWTDPSLAFTPSPTPVGFIHTVYEDSWSIATFEVEITAADIVAATAHCAADGADGCERAAPRGGARSERAENEGRAWVAVGASVRVGRRPVGLSSRSSARVDTACSFLCTCAFRYGSCRTDNQRPACDVPFVRMGHRTDGAEATTDRDLAMQRAYLSTPAAGPGGGA